MPIVLFFQILRNTDDATELLEFNQKIQKIKSKSNLQKQEMIAVERYAKQYGFLFMGFKEKVFYWELVVMSRKLLVIFGV